MNFWFLNNASHRVAKVLKTLPEGYIKTTNFYAGRKGKIDFVIIGPTGIWSIEVLNNSGKVIYNEHLEKVLSYSYSKARELQNYIRKYSDLSAHVNPVIIYANPNARVNFGLELQDGVYVVDNDTLIGLIINHFVDKRFTSELCNKLKEELGRNP